jgi:hypothetical protein
MIWLILLILYLPSAVWAQSYETMQMLRPVAVGAAGTGLDAENRVYRAYTGIEYNIHADARGGKWPYTYSLSNAPAGMTIEAGPCTTIGPTCTAGTITWPSPTGTASNIVVRVTDSLGSYVEGTWTVTSSTTIGADGFCFVDVNNAAGGRNGSLANPYNSLLEVYNSCGARSILYLRGGTYLPTVDLVSVCSDGSPAEYGCISTWSEASRPIIWIGYPGETAIIDFQSDGTNVAGLISTSGQNTWIDNLELTNIGNMAFRFNIRNGYGAVVRRITAHDLRDGNESNNSAFFMWTGAASPDQSYWDTVQNSTFTTVGGDGGGATDNSAMLKTYGIMRAVIETSSFDDSSFPEGVIALKSSSNMVTVRANTCGITTSVNSCVGGNMSMDTTDNNPTGGEIYHNLFKAAGTSADPPEGTLVMADGYVDQVDPFAVYRNTLIGRLAFVQNSISTTCGPYTFYDNVIVNGGGEGGSCPLRANCLIESGTPNYSQWVDNGDNVMGANDGSIANSTTGELVGASRTTYLGVAGFELGNSSSRRFSPSFLRRVSLEVEP